MQVYGVVTSLRSSVLNWSRLPPDLENRPRKGFQPKHLDRFVASSKATSRSSGIVRDAIHIGRRCARRFPRTTFVGAADREHVPYPVREPLKDQAEVGRG